MSDNANETHIETAADFKPSRSAIRNGIFQAGKTKTKVIEFFGQKVEVRQPSMRALLALQSDETSSSARAAQMIVGYTFVPDTEEKVFDPADVDMLQDMPFGSDMQRMNNTISELTGITPQTVQDAEKNSEETQID